MKVQPLVRAAGACCSVVLLLAAGCATGAVTPPTRAGAPSVDPRVGLRPGITNAGVAARNMEELVIAPRPPGFFNPADHGDGAFSNTDLAFRGNLAFLGNYHGILVYDIAQPRSPRLVSRIVCPGGQGDVSIHGNLLFMSVQETRARIDCGTQGVAAAVSPERFRGVRIFDVTDLNNPRQIAAVQTCRGSHTHTLLQLPGDAANLYVVNSGTSVSRAAAELPGCAEERRPDDPTSPYWRIEIIQVPLAAPQQARVISEPRVFADPATGAIAGLWLGGAHGEGTQTTRETSQCHDVTTYPEIGLAAGACSGNGILFDISNPAAPKRVDEVVDVNFAFWHSATFNNDGTKVIFTDEWGGGTAPRCQASDPRAWGANAIFDVVDRKLVFRSYYKLPAPQTEMENCVAHNGSLVPVPGRDIKVQAWYQGGVSVFDFTDSASPVEIAFFDRGPVSASELITGGYWSSYWYNGAIYGSEITRGLSVFRLTPSEHLSQNEIDAANLVRYDEFNAQHQPRITWPASIVVARAYLDQLERRLALPQDQLARLRNELGRAERDLAGADRSAAQSRLDANAAQLESAARAVPGGEAGQDARRLRALAATLRGLSRNE